MSKKIKPELIDALKEQKRKDFLEASDKSRQELIEKFGFQLVPVVRTMWHGGTEPGLAIQEVEKVKLQKANADSNQSEAIERTDSDDKAPQE